jgi:hypothetical protein
MLRLPEGAKDVVLDIFISGVQTNAITLKQTIAEVRANVIISEQTNTEVRTNVTTSKEETAPDTTPDLLKLVDGIIDSKQQTELPVDISDDQDRPSWPRYSNWRQFPLPIYVDTDGPASAEQSSQYAAAYHSGPVYRPTHKLTLYRPLDAAWFPSMKKAIMSVASRNRELFAYYTVCGHLIITNSLQQDETTDSFTYNVGKIITKPMYDMFTRRLIAFSRDTTHICFATNDTVYLAELASVGSHIPEDQRLLKYVGTVNMIGVGGIVAVHFVGRTNNRIIIHCRHAVFLAQFIKKDVMHMTELIRDSFDTVAVMQNLIAAATYNKIVLFNIVTDMMRVIFLSSDFYIDHIEFLDPLPHIETPHPREHHLDPPYERISKLFVWYSATASVRILDVNKIETSATLALARNNLIDSHGPKSLAIHPSGEYFAIGHRRAPYNNPTARGVISFFDMQTCEPGFTPAQGPMLCSHALCTTSDEGVNIVPDYICFSSHLQEPHAMVVVNNGFMDGFGGKAMMFSLPPARKIAVQ